MIERNNIIAFVAGAVSVYVVARLATPYLRTKIATGVGEQIVVMQRNAIGGTVITQTEATANIGIPIANSVLSSLYLQ